MISIKVKELLLCLGIIFLLKDANAAEGNGTPEVTSQNPDGISPETYNGTETNFQGQASTRNVTIIVMGRSGSGISSTIRQLLRQNEVPRLNENFLVKEYMIATPENTFLKIVDVEGVVDGKTPEHDAKTLATLKSYLTNLKESLGEEPDIFLVISRFDDNRYIGSQSTFIQAVKRAQVLQTSMYGRTTPNSIFLMTRFMSETKAIQRRPKDKIKLFQGCIANYSQFQLPIHVTVGENLPEPDIVNPEDGYAKLPNKEFYPKNVFNLMANITRSIGSESSAAILEAFRDNRAAYPAPTVTGFPNNTNSAEIGELLNLIQLTSFDIEFTQVNMALRQAFDTITDPAERQHIQNAIPMLQIHLQNSNIKLMSQLPHRSLDRVKFFQNLPPSLEMATLKLLQKSIEDFLPEFVQQPLVGSSFDVTTDETFPISPFKSDKLISSSVGYLLPSYIICSKVSSHNTKDHLHSVDKLDDYVRLRMDDLNFPERTSNYNISSFNGKVKTGFNLSPEPGVIPSVSTVREIRKFLFQLDPNYDDLSIEFLDESSALNPLRLSDRDSVNEWRQYFSKFGTHVVSSAYVGGRIEGLVVDNEIQNLTSVARTTLLSNAVNYEHISMRNKPTYRFFGGERSLELERVYDIPADSRSALLAEWTKSVSYDPIALDYELELKPISQLFTNVNITLGEEIERSAKLLLTGKLVYTRVKKNSTRTRTTTPSYNLGAENNSSRDLVPEFATEPVINPSPGRLPNDTEEDITYSTAKPNNARRSSTPAQPSNSQRFDDNNNGNRSPNQERPPRTSTTEASAQFNPVQYPNLSPEKLANHSHYINEALKFQEKQNQQQTELLDRVASNKAAAARRDEDETKRQAERRKQEVLDEQARLERRRHQIVLEQEKLQKQYEDQAESLKKMTDEDIRRRNMQFEDELKQIEARTIFMIETIKNITTENERRQRENQKACLKKGTLILMADRTEKSVESIKVGDMILDHELRPTRVTGALEKFLFQDSFHGFNENGPYFFTDTHIMVGPNQDKTGAQLLVNSLDHLIAENPLMSNLNVKQFNKSGTNFFAYDQTQDEVVTKFQKVFTDPNVYDPETLVHIIEVESPSGTYFANGYVCRHELPPLELWPNTVNLILSLAVLADVQRIANAEYTMENVMEVVKGLEKMHDKIDVTLRGVFSESKSKQLEESLETQINEVASADMVDSIFTKPMLLAYFVGLYGKVGPLISEMLDNPNFVRSPEEMQYLRLNIINCVLEETKSISFLKY